MKKCSTKRTYLIIFQDGTKHCLKPTSVVKVSMALDNGHDLMSKLVESDGGGLVHKPKEMQYMYMQTQGAGLETISPKDVLESIADFSAISTRKAKARLELFASPAYKYPSTKKPLLKFLNQSIFEDIEEKGHVGCGFICEDFLVEILGMNAIAEKAICIQCRIFIPMKGVYKGMLMKKRIKNGPKILLPSSMQKICRYSRALDR